MRQSVSLVVLLMVTLALLCAGCTNGGDGYVVLDQRNATQRNAADDPNTLDVPSAPSDNLQQLSTIEHLPVGRNATEYTIAGTEGDLITIPADILENSTAPLLRQHQVSAFPVPFDAQGRWQTHIGDAGRYVVPVRADDGMAEHVVNVEIIVHIANTPPVLAAIPDIAVQAGDPVFIPIDAYDREGDVLSYKVIGWMTNQTSLTDQSDVGNHTAVVIVSDGKLSISQTVHIIVRNSTHAPVFILPQR